MSEQREGTRKQELAAIFEEYRALYDLALFRLSALDKRAPVAVTAFAAVLVSVQSLPVPSQLLVLLFLPPSLIWLMRTTVNHARSFEDALRRIEELEKAANARLDEPILGFQSQHPSRGKEVGGRTGRETVLAMLSSILLFLVVAGYQMHTTELIPPTGQLWYGLALIAIGVLCIRQRILLSRYTFSSARKKLIH